MELNRNAQKVGQRTNAVKPKQFSLLDQQIFIAKNLVHNLGQLARLDPLQTVQVPISLFRQPRNLLLLIVFCHVNSQLGYSVTR